MMSVHRILWEEYIRPKARFVDPDDYFSVVTPPSRNDIVERLVVLSRTMTELEDASGKMFDDDSYYLVLEAAEEIKLLRTELDNERSKKFMTPPRAYTSSSYSTSTHSWGIASDD